MKLMYSLLKHNTWQEKAFIFLMLSNGENRRETSHFMVLSFFCVLFHFVCLPLFLLRLNPSMDEINYEKY